MQYSGICLELVCGKTFLIMSSGGVGSRMSHADQRLPSRTNLYLQRRRNVQILISNFLPSFPLLQSVPFFFQVATQFLLCFPT